MSSFLATAPQDIKHRVLDVLPPHLRVPDKSGNSLAERRSNFEAWQRATCPLLRASILTQLAALRDGPIPSERPHVKVNGVTMSYPFAHSRRQEFHVIAAVVLLLFPHKTTLHDETLRIEIGGPTGVTVDFLVEDEERAKAILQCQQTLRLFKEECESRTRRLHYLHRVDISLIWHTGLNLSKSGRENAQSLLTNIFAASAFMHSYPSGRAYPLRR